MTTTLSHDEARRVYDRMGARHDLMSAWYEDRALDRIVEHGEFGHAHRVFEFGSGTGRFAERLLAGELPEDARYRAWDLSPRMVALARERLARFGERVEILHSDGSPPTSEPDASCDRFVSSYVFDLLSDADIDAVLAEAQRMLVPGGLLCVTSLASGCSGFAGVVGGLWSRIHAFRPTWVGGCRPIQLAPRLDPSRWRPRHVSQLAPLGLAIEVVVAERPADAGGGTPGTPG